MNESNFWTTLGEIGWLALLSEAEHVRLQGAVREQFVRDSKYAFYALAVTVFDPECIEGTGPNEACSYYSVLLQLAKASGGCFQPLLIHDELDYELGVARVSFEHYGHAYSIEVSYQDDWFQQEVLDLVNRALRESGCDRQFLPLPPCDQTVSLCFVPADVFDRAVRKGLIPEVEFFEAS